MAEPRVQTMQISTYQWLSLLLAVAGGVAATLTMMWQLDNKWDQKTDIITREIRAEIAQVRDMIPPDWFRKMVENNQTQIAKNSDRMNGIDKSLTEIMTLIRNLDK